MATTKAAKDAKDALQQAITSFKCAETVLNRTFDLPNTNARNLQNRMTKVEEALDSLNACHTAWVLKSEFTDEILEAETYNNAWLDSIWKSK